MFFILMWELEGGGMCTLENDKAIGTCKAMRKSRGTAPTHFTWIPILPCAFSDSISIQYIGPTPFNYSAFTP